MGIQLFQHNQIAYQAAVSMMAEEGKAAVIHPTGTGKSFIAFKLAEDNPEARICWLSPSEYIFKTQLENLHHALKEGEVFSAENILFLSYTKLMMNEEGMDEIRPDYIVLDEFHRCGAAEWGRSVQKLLEMYPKAKILGLSATNVRYLDNQRDMAQEIFEGNIASEMTLGEAMAKEILRTPRYVIAMYSYKRELKKLEQAVANLGNEGLVSQNKKLLEQLRRSLEQAEGLDSIFQKHMPKKNGKYILFCMNKEHMDELKEYIREWFCLVDENPHVYTAYYNSPDTSREFEAFKADDSEHLKLLLCIDMLNEGVHVEDVDGVILLRPTVSPIVYLQQIGRCLSAGTTGEPVIFDLVNNTDSLYCIDCLEQEIEEAFSLMPCTRGERKRFYERFRVTDELKDCRALFRQLQSNLSSSWETYYLAAANYYREQGHLKIPKSYVTSTGLTLGSWVQTQRKVYAGKVPGNLTEEKIRLLNDIGMLWDVRTDAWEEAYGELKAYYEAYGNTDVKARYISPAGYPLGKWVSNLRAGIKKKGVDGMLSEEQRERLEALGMIWDKNGEKRERYLRAAEEYHRQYGNLQVPVRYVTEDGVKLGKWISNIRVKRKNPEATGIRLDEENIRELDGIGMIWN